MEVWFLAVRGSLCTISQTRDGAYGSGVALDEASLGNVSGQDVTAASWWRRIPQLFVVCAAFAS